MTNKIAAPGIRHLNFPLFYGPSLMDVFFNIMWILLLSLLYLLQYTQWKEDKTLKFKH